MSDRYGAPSPARRAWVIAGSGLVGIAALGWLAWAVWFHSTPEVQSSLRGYDVVDVHRTTASVAVRTDDAAVEARCVVRAIGEDHSVVGEVDFTVSGVAGTTTRDVSLRTEREATSVELVGCTTGEQSRPR